MDACQYMRILAFSLLAKVSKRGAGSELLLFHNLKQVVLTRRYGEGAVRVAFCKSGFKGEAGGFSQASNSFGNF